MTNVPFLNPSMQDSTIASPGLYDLLYPTWETDILRVYEENLQVFAMLPRKQIPTGTRTEIVATGRLHARTHERGELITGFGLEQSRYFVDLDERPFITSHEEEDLDAMIRQVNTSSVYQEAIGRALAENAEVEAMKAVAIAARTPAKTITLTGDTSTFPGGGLLGTGAPTVVAALATPNAAAAQAFIATLDSILVRWDDISVPTNDRVAFVSPALWHALRKVPTLIAEGANRFYPSPAGVGAFENPQASSSALSFNSYAGFDVSLEYCGIKIYKSAFFNRFATDRRADRARNADFSPTRAIIFQKDAAAMVEKMAPTMVLEKPSRSTNLLMYARHWLGSGTIRPQNAVELVVSNPAV